METFIFFGICVLFEHEMTTLIKIVFKLHKYFEAMSDLDPMLQAHCIHNIHIVA